MAERNGNRVNWAQTARFIAHLTCMCFAVFVPSCAEKPAPNGKRSAVDAPSATVTASGKGMGYVPATAEQRNRVPFALAPLRGTLPRSIDLSGLLPEPGHQGAQPSCVGWAVAYGLKSYQEAVERRAKVPPSAKDEVFSPAFIYNQIKLPRGGASLIDALNLLRRDGAATLMDMALDDPRFPDRATKLRAERFRIDFWRRLNVNNVDEAKAQLAAGFPVLVGANVDSSFENASRGFVWRSQGAIVGGHAMVLVGYDDSKGAFKVLNSWGRNWCDDGYGWMDYQLYRVAVQEAYIAKDAGNDVTTPAVPEVVHTDVDVGDRPSDLVFFVEGTDPADQLGTDATTIRGEWQVPVGLGSEVQIALYIVETDGRSGDVIGRFRSLDTEFADSYGYVVFASPKYKVPETGRRAGKWQLKIVPDRIVWPQRRSYWYNVRLVMFVDGFGIDQTGRRFDR